MISIIGGSGFIGTYVCSTLENLGHDFNIYDKSIETPFKQRHTLGNILDRDLLYKSLNGTRVVVNLAAEHKDNVSPSSLYYDVNVEGARNLCAVCEQRNINTIVFTSSVAIYGLDKPNPDENFPPDPFNDYGKSKWEAEEVYRGWHKKDPENRVLIIIRPTVVFGENNRGNVYNLLSQISSGKFIKVGSGKNQKSMAYVQNVSDFIIYSLFHFKKGLSIYNYSDIPDLNMNQLIKVCEDELSIKIPPIIIPSQIGFLVGRIFDIFSFLTKREYPISYIRIKKYCSTTQFDSRKAHGSGFESKYTLIEGIRRTLKHEFF